MKKAIFIFFFLILVILILVSGWLVLRNYFLKPNFSKIANFEDCVSAGYPVLESYPRQCKTKDGQTFSEDIGNELEKMDLIRIENPRPNQTITSPLIIKGEARGYWFFEASFPLKMLDGNGNLVAQGIAQAKKEWMTSDFVPFEAVLEFENPKTKKGLLILEKNNPSGLAEHSDELRVPVYFNQEPSKKITIKVFFNNSKMDSEFSCNKVFPVERKIPKTLAVARAALEELLKGPTEQEKLEGFLTSINSGVKIQSLNIENGLAKVDFDERLEYQVGGSCRVSAIRAQITETLKQFPTVDNVIISINGRTEDILQP